MKSRKTKYTIVTICMLAVLTPNTVYADNAKYQGEVQRFAITGEEYAVPIEKGDSQIPSDSTKPQDENEYEIELSPEANTYSGKWPNNFSN